MIPVQKNLVFIPENVNTSSESDVSIILRNQEFLTTKTSEILLFEDDDLKWTEMEFVHRQFLGYLDNKPCYANILKDSSAIPQEMMLSSLRNLLGRIPDNLFVICSRSLQICDWYTANQFCGYCGKKTTMHEKERAMICDCNNVMIYPRISPCIIVLVTRGEE